MACEAVQRAKQVVMAGPQVSTVVLHTTPQRRPSMTFDQTTRPATVLVGIDIAKNRHEVLDVTEN